jgi:ubiquinone/menaquinone biosynthesis C-methylase UbiE
MNLIYVSPGSLLPLRVRNRYVDNRKRTLSGEFMADDGKIFPVRNGIVDFLGPSDLSQSESNVCDFYNARAEDYDKFLHLTFYTHNEDETRIRESFIDLLDLKPDSKVLEIAAGTGRDSEIIAGRLGPEAQFYITDIADKMLERCIKRLNHFTELQLEFALCSVSKLPFPDNIFDALYSFGGLGEFSDIPGSLKEMARVVRFGGKIVVGDESMPPWLRQTKFAKILTTTNPQFDAPLPLEHLPVVARKVRLQWVIGGVFYLIDFEVGEGEPQGNFDFEIPGFRGGTYRTRYEGQLEGVTPEAKQLYQAAAKKSGKSLHQWLDEAVKFMAKKELK